MFFTAAVLYFYWTTNNKLVNKLYASNIDYKFKTDGLGYQEFLEIGNTIPSSKLILIGSREDYIEEVQDISNDIFILDPGVETNNLYHINMEPHINIKFSQPKLFYNNSLIINDGELLNSATYAYSMSSSAKNARF